MKQTILDLMIILGLKDTMRVIEKMIENRFTVIRQLIPESQIPDFNEQASHLMVSLKSTAIAFDNYVYQLNAIVPEAVGKTPKSEDFIDTIVRTVEYVIENEP